MIRGLAFAAAVVGVGALGFGCASSPDAQLDEHLARQSSALQSGTPVSTSGRIFVTTDAPSIAFSGLPGNATDWITIAPDQSPLTTYGEWHYTSGAQSGSTGFASLPVGTYVARSFLNDSFSLSGESPAFSVIAPPAVAPGASMYTAGSTVLVNVSGMPSGTHDWVALAAPGSSKYTHAAWQYTGGGASAALNFANVPVGTYVARTFYDDGWELLSESSSFTVTALVPTIASRTLYEESTQGSRIDFTNLSGSNTDWVAITTPGAPAGTFVTWAYVNGASGSVTLTGVPVGTYVARAFYQDSYNLAVESAQFTVQTLAPTAASYAPYVTGPRVNYDNMPGNAQDAIVIAAVGDPLDQGYAWAYTAGAVSGTFDIGALPPGTYEARAFLNNSYTEMVVSAPFTVLDTSVATDASSYTTSQSVTVSYSDMPGNSDDWIGIALQGDPATAIVLSQDTNGAVSGTAVFSGLAAGTYEARAYGAGSWNIIKTSSAFTVN